MSTKLISIGSKFVMVGIISTVLNYALFWFLAQILSVNYLISSISGYLFGLICGFVINNFWTFQFGKFNWGKILGYLLVYMSSLVVSSIFLKVVVDTYQANIWISNFIALCISTTTNFLGLNYLIYKK